MSTVIIENAQNERVTYLQNLKNGLESEVLQIYDLISILEKRNEYTTEELAEYYVTQSHNGYFFPFIRYRVKILKSENRTKTASIYETVQRSFSRFRYGEDVRIDKIDGILSISGTKWSIC